MSSLFLIGIWNGTIYVHNIPLLIVLEFMKVNIDNKIEIKGYVDIPDVYVKRYFINNLNVTQNELDFYLPSLQGGFSGNFSGSQLKGVWSDRHGVFPVIMKKLSNITRYNTAKPQTPKKPYPYIEEDVLIWTRDDLVLSGTLTYPKNKKAYAAVVLAHGSGGQDRDETLWEHKPFMVIADYLTRDGLAVLRYDERGIKKSTGDYFSANDVDFANDVVAAVEFLKNRNDLNIEKYGVIGHSKGGLTAMLAANISDCIDFVVFLATPGVKLKEAINLHVTALNKVLDRPSSAARRSLEAQYYLFELSKIEKDKEILKEKFLEYLDQQIETAVLEDEIDLMIVRRDSIQYGLVDFISSPWFHSAWNFNAKDALKGLDLPILALWGSNDINIPARDNYNGLKRTIEGLNYDLSKLCIIEGLNHYFKSSDSGSPLEYGLLEETFSIKVLKIISSWIKNNHKNMPLHSFDGFC